MLLIVLLTQRCRSSAGCQNLNDVSVLFRLHIRPFGGTVADMAPQMSFFIFLNDNAVIACGIASLKHCEISYQGASARMCVDKLEEAWLSTQSNMVMSNGRKRRWSVSAESTDFSLWKFMFPFIDLIQSFMDFLLGDAHMCFPLHYPVKAGFLISIFSPRQFCLKIWFYLKEHLGGTEYSPFSFSHPILIV